MTLTRLLPFTCLALLGLASCSKESDSNGAESSKLEVRLMDAPGDFRSVVLDVRQIEVHLKKEKDAEKRQTLTFTPVSCVSLLFKALPSLPVGTLRAVT